MQLAYISFLHKSCCCKTQMESLSLQISMTRCSFDGARRLHDSLCLQSVFIRTHEARGQCLIYYLQVFHDTEHNLLQPGAEKRLPSCACTKHTRARACTHTRLGISITNDWKNMMTNNDALQGQKYTNGAGAVPQRMMATAADVCSLQMASCTLSAVSSLSARGTPGELFRCGRAGISLSWIPYGACSVYLKAFRPVNKCTTSVIMNRFATIKKKKKSIIERGFVLERQTQVGDIHAAASQTSCLGGETA